MRSNTQIRIILPAGDIPDGSTVSKRTGEAKFTLVHKLVIYTYPQKELGKLPNVIQGFFINNSRSISQVSPDTELVWYTTPDELLMCVEKSYVEQ